MNTRTLKIESAGDFFNGKVSPKIRLVGQWLERAGFKPGCRVEVQIGQPGILTLRFLGKTECPSAPISDAQAECPDILQGCVPASAWARQGVLELKQANYRNGALSPSETK